VIVFLCIYIDWGGGGGGALELWSPEIFVVDPQTLPKAFLYLELMQKC